MKPGDKVNARYYASVAFVLGPWASTCQAHGRPQGQALETWHGRDEKLKAVGRPIPSFSRNSAAAYTDDLGSR